MFVSETIQAIHMRKFNTYVIVILSIFCANILQELILSWLPDLKQWGNPYQSTAIRMAIMVVVFTPVFALLDEYVTYAAKTYVRTSKQVVGSSLYGLIVGVII